MAVSFDDLMLGGRTYVFEVAKQDKLKIKHHGYCWKNRVFSVSNLNSLLLCFERVFPISWHRAITLRMEFNHMRISVGDPDLISFHIAYIHNHEKIPSL